MTGDTVSLFVNPKAGRGRAGRRFQRIKQLFVNGGIAIHVTESRSAGDLEESVTESVNAGTKRVVVVGGDGSVHEAVNAILRTGASASLGIVPAGTGNDFAKACGVPLAWEHATQLLIERLVSRAPTRAIDVGRMNDRYFANGAGIGFDARVTRIANSYRWPIGDLVYLVAIFEGLWDGVITPTVKMTYDNACYEGSITLANISNGPWVGGMFHIAPMARIDDGSLDLIVAKPVTRRKILALLPKLIRGTHIDSPEIYSQEIRHFRLVADAPVPSHLDGETQPMQTEFEVEILDQALSLL